jgi:S1-C subfamily serine protease
MRGFCWSFCVLGALWGPLAFSQKSTEDVLGNVRDSVVSVEVFLHSRNGLGSPTIPLPACLQDSCILGTGVVVSESGDVLTASHVAAAALQMLGPLRAGHVDVQLVVGVSFGHYNDGQFILKVGTREVPAEVKAVDPVHDLALLHVSELPRPYPLIRTPSSLVSEGGWPRPIKIAPERARDAEPVFVCGFPLGEQALVTTSGEVASAWSSGVVLTAIGRPDAEPIDLYKLDIQLTHGNSGGPVFRLSDQAVVGIVIEGSDTIIGAPPVAVPSEYIATFLTQNGVTWVAAKTK